MHTCQKVDANISVSSPRNQEMTENEPLPRKDAISSPRNPEKTENEPLPGKDAVDSPRSPESEHLPKLTGAISSPLSFSGTDAAVCIPVQRIRCGKWDARTDCRWLEYEPSTSSLTFFWRDHKHSSDHDHCAAFLCQDISAADLRVVAKFGYFDAMTGTLTIECRRAIQVNQHDVLISSSSYVLEVTFHVNHTGQLRDILRSLRNAKKADASIASADNTDDGNATGIVNKQSLREGLPDWVPYIPHRLYSPTVRRTLELVIMIYTMFSIAWACWQLYRHVDFIQAYVRPVIDTLKYHIHLLDRSLQFLNTVFEEVTLQWLGYLKPAYVLLTSFASPLISTGKQVWLILSNLTGALQVVFQPILNVIYPLLHLLHLVFIKFPCTVLQPVYHLLSKLWSIFREIVVFRLLSTQIAGLKSVVSNTMEVLERSMRLDPLKAQLILMRSNVLNSGKALGLGLVYIFKSIERRVWVLIRHPHDNEKEE